MRHCMHRHASVSMAESPPVHLRHLSVGCNRVAECLDWGAHGLIAYGAHNQAIIYDPEVC